MKKLMVLIALTVFATVAANAQYRSESWSRDRTYEPATARSARGSEMTLNAMQREAREKIAHGIVNGSITSREARYLLEMAERIEMKENRFLRNGRLTSAERRDLEGDLAELDRSIRTNKRDREHSNADRYVHGKRY